MERARVLSLGLLMVLALFAQRSFAQGVVKSRSWPVSPQRTRGSNFISDAVAAKYPDIKLDWEVVGWPDLPSKIQEYMKSGLPDIIVGKERISRRSRREISSETSPASRI